MKTYIVKYWLPNQSELFSDPQRVEIEKIEKYGYKLEKVEGKLC